MENKSLSPFRTVMVPGWIHRKLLRNNMNTIDLTEYSKVRGILSTDDMAEWFYLNDKFRINDSLLTNIFLESIWVNLTKEQSSEVKNSVLPLSGSEEIAHSAKSKLVGSNPMSEKYYEFIKIDTTIYVVLNEGFMSKIQEPDSLLEFVKNYLKVCYAMASVTDVAKLNIFKLYVQQFTS